MYSPFANQLCSSHHSLRHLVDVSLDFLTLRNCLYNVTFMLYVMCGICRMPAVLLTKGSSKSKTGFSLAVMVHLTYAANLPGTISI